MAKTQLVAKSVCQHNRTSHAMLDFSGSCWVLVCTHNFAQHMPWVQQRAKPNLALHYCYGVVWMLTQLEEVVCKFLCGKMLEGQLCRWDSNLLHQDVKETLPAQVYQPDEQSFLAAS